MPNYLRSGNGNPTGQDDFFMDSNVFWVLLTKSETIISCPAEPGFKLPNYAYITAWGLAMGILPGRMIFFLILMYFGSL